MISCINLKSCETKVATMETTDCIIFDAMAVIQMLPVPSKTVNLTFVDMDEQYIDYIIQISHIYASISQIHIIFDSYDENILRPNMPKKRRQCLGQKIQIQPDMTIPKEWKISYLEVKIKKTFGLLRKRHSRNSWQLITNK